MESLSRKVLLLFAIGLFAALVTATEYLARQEQQHEFDDLWQTIYAEASSIRANIEHEINTTLNLTLGLLVYVSVYPDISEEDFNRIAQKIMTRTPILRNLALARDNVITHVYPLRGNEQALGLDYMQSPRQRDAVLRAIETGNTVIAGPVNLVQGGKGFISRIPIFLGREEQRYWGIASLAIDADTFYDIIGLNTPNQDVRFAIQGKDGLGEQGAVFYGEARLFSDPRNPRVTIDLPDGSWILAAAPQHGWHDYSIRILLIRSIGYTLAAVISALLLTLLVSYRNINLQALHDPLTNLPNRRLLQEYFAQYKAVAQRAGKHFYILYFDLDQFKPVNDRFGHKEGDRVLIEVANRLKGCLRETDIISRVGGDEFVLLLHSFEDPKGMAQIKQKISSEICKPYRLSNGEAVQLGVSIGTSIYPNDGTLYDELISRADSDMYLNKSTRS